jgi:hypothetical protein
VKSSSGCNPTFNKGGGKQIATTSMSSVRYLKGMLDRKFQNHASNFELAE